MRNVLIALALVVPLLSAPVGADRGGGDAPDDWTAPLDVEPGSFTGTVGGDDAVDWYRVTAPEPLGVRATLTAHVPDEHKVNVGLWSADGETLYNIRSAREPWPTDVVAGGRGGEFLVGVGAGTGSHPVQEYTLRIELAHLPDLAITSFSVERVHGSPTAAPVEPASPAQKFRATVENTGGEDATAYLYLNVHGSTDGRKAYSDQWMHVDVPAGEVVHLDRSWAAVNLVGDFRATLYMTVHPDEARPREGNHATTDGSTFIAGTGLGVSTWYFSPNRAVKDLIPW